MRVRVILFLEGVPIGMLSVMIWRAISIAIIKCAKVFNYCWYVSSAVSNAVFNLSKDFSYVAQSRAISER